MRIGLLASVGETLDAFFPEIVEVWDESGHEVFTAAGSASGLGKFTLLPAITRQPRTRNLHALKQLRRWVSANNIDVVVTNTATASALSRIARIGVPVVYFCHGLHWGEQPARLDYVWKGIEKALLPRTAGVAVLNSHDENWFRRQTTVPVKRLKYGVGLDTVVFERSERPITESVLWVGEFSLRKNPMLAVEVFSRVRECHPHARLTMLGEGALLEPVQRRVDQLGLQDCVYLEGRKPVLSYIEATNVLMHTSAWEGLARVLLEAAAVGRPAVGFDVKGVRDAPGTSVVPLGDLDGMARTVSAFLAGEADYDPIQAELLEYRRTAVALSTFLLETATGEGR